MNVVRKDSRENKSCERVSSLNAQIKYLQKELAEEKAILNAKALTFGEKEFRVGDFLVSLKPRKIEKFDLKKAKEDIPKIVKKYLTLSTCLVLRVTYGGK